MTILDTFTLLFTSDSSKLKADLAAVEKQIDTLKAKGKSRSEQENKDLKEQIKNQKDLKESLADSTKETNNFTDSLTDAAAAFVGFHAARAGVTNSNNFNSDLKVQADLLGQSARSMDLYAQAAEAAGGSKAGMLSSIAAWQNDLVRQGLPVGKFSDAVASVRETLSHYNGPNAEGAKKQYLDALGWANDPGFRRMLLKPEEFNKQMGAAEANNNKTDEDYANARQTNDQLSHIGQILDNIWSKFSTLIGPTASGALTGEVGHVIEGGLLLKLGQVVARKVLGAGAGAAVGAVGLTGAAIVGAGALVGGAAAYYGGDFGRWIDRKLHPSYYNKKGPGQSGSSKSGSAMDYWISKGKTVAEAAAIVASENAESGGDPTAHHMDSDHKEHVGLFQWSPERAAAILKGTSIDVRTASAEKQRDAADWEMHNLKGFDPAKFHAMSDPAEGGSYFSMNFEKPHDKLGQAMARAKSALGIASSYSPPGSLGNSSNSSSTSVNIQKIEINTQATDSKGIADSIAGHLSSVFGKVAAIHDDGVSA